MHQTSAVTNKHVKEPFVFSDRVNYLSIAEKLQLQYSRQFSRVNASEVE